APVPGALRLPVLAVGAARLRALPALRLPGRWLLRVRAALARPVCGGALPARLARLRTSPARQALRARRLGPYLWLAVLRARIPPNSHRWSWPPATRCSGEARLSPGRGTPAAN